MIIDSSKDETRSSTLDQETAGKASADTFFGEAFLVEMEKHGNAQVLSPNIVELNEPKIYSEESNAYVEKFTAILRANFPFAPIMQSGDSGGPLYCRRNRSSPQTLVGINEGISTILAFMDSSRTKLAALMKSQIWAYPNAEMIPVPGFVAPVKVKSPSKP
jgi:hypothetical protein